MSKTVQVWFMGRLMQVFGVQHPGKKGEYVSYDGAAIMEGAPINWHHLDHPNSLDVMQTELHSEQDAPSYKSWEERIYPLSRSFRLALVDAYKASGPNPNSGKSSS